jgi:hypothetical protein
VSPRRLGIVLCLALLPAAPAQAFDTGPHADVTRDALTAEGFNATAGNIASVENWLVDFYSQASSNPYSGHDKGIDQVLALATHSEHWPQSWLDAASVMHFDSTLTLHPGAASKTLANTPGIEQEWGRLMRNTDTVVLDAEPP